MAARNTGRDLVASADVTVLLSRGPFNAVRDATSSAMSAVCECCNYGRRRVNEGRQELCLVSSEVEARFLGEAEGLSWAYFSASSLSQLHSRKTSYKYLKA